MSLKIHQTFQGLLSSQELAKVVEVANKLGFNPNWLLAVMYFETAKTFSPSITNGIGSVGLIQFTKDKAGVNYKTIKGNKYYLSDIGKMTFIEQMDLVYLYYKEAMGSRKVKSFIDCYLVTFFPVALGKSDNFLFETKNLSASLIAKQNPIFDNENGKKDGLIYKREVTNYFRKLYNNWGFDFDNDIALTPKTATTGIFLAVLVFFYTGYTAIQVIPKIM